MHKKTLRGLLGVLGIWLTAGLALPFVNVLDNFTPTQLMVFRGFFTAFIAIVLLKGVIGKVDRYTYLIALVLPLATLGLFEGIRAWGAGATIIILTATPIVNIIIGLFIGRKITRASLLGLVLLLFGVGLARWGGNFQWEGMLWSLFATIMNGILYELFARARATSLQKCFYACTGMGLLGLILSFQTSWAALADDPQSLLLLISFGFVGGFLYWLANLMAFENLPTTEASILAQGETPAVILGASILLGEHLTLIQWIGVAVALFGAWHVSRWLAKQNA